MRSELDCLFLHPVRRERQSGSLELTHLIMPVGLLAIAAFLEDHGFNTRVVHTGLEQMLDERFEPSKTAKRFRPEVVAIDLHWCSHAYDAVELARACKESLGCAVVLGGFTASFFDAEILKRFPFIDAVVRGEGELPMLRFMESLDEGLDLTAVPNLSYRRGEAIVRNPLSYVADEEAVSQLDFTRLSLLEHWEDYIRLMSLKSRLDEPNFLRRGWLSVGRGCSFNCSYCGGGLEAQRIISGRTQPVFRRKEKVVEDIVKLQERSVRELYVDFDPYPEDRRYYRELFEMLRREKVDIGCELLTWGLPDDEFIADFAGTFDPYFSMITISPETGSEPVRRLNRGCPYSNEALTRQVEALQKSGVYAQLFFSVGLTGETPRDFTSTIKLAEQLKGRFQNIIGPWCYGVAIEPAAPRFLNPKAHGLTLYRKRFMDFYRFEAARAAGKTVAHPYGYRTEHMDEETIERFEKQFAATVNVSKLEP
ncbi:MAG: radical SAM protein [Candidatus Bathyarchaeia archaeon]